MASEGGAAPVAMEAGEPMSKSALKKLEKAKKAAEEKKLKEEKKKAEAAAKPQRAQNAADADDEDMDPTQYRTNRLRVLGELKEKQTNPYPHKFHTTMSIPQYIQDFDAIKDGEHLNSKDVSVAGRLSFF